MNEGRKRRALGDILYANLTRNDVEANRAFTLGDGMTYGGYINHALEDGIEYYIRVQYASCTPVDEVDIILLNLNQVCHPNMLHTCIKCHSVVDIHKISFIPKL